MVLAYRWLDGHTAGWVSDGAVPLGIARVTICAPRHGRWLELGHELREDPATEVLAWDESVDGAQVSAERYLPRVILVEVGLSGLRPKRIVQDMPAVSPLSMIAFVAREIDPDVLDLFGRWPVRGYFLWESSPPGQIVFGLQTMLREGCACSPEVIEALRSDTQADWRVVVTQTGLTEIEVEELHLVTDGTTNPEIAAALGYEVNTIKKHLKKLRQKIGERSRNGAIAFGKRHGFGRKPGSG